ncbi:TorF family putative porin [Paraglaciecola aquimarina]|uniref:TorF family putative porin n=1 Tax=Paraglaciecola aquimarina TaxID=1235557 RepID=A0ABU3SS39_9ALTE|nr:TorF family putative porin [Paraglaciecola aquimarina]MDU0352797.1 TorF family putative porin [Paraglaciecola aquimarina]
MKFLKLTTLAAAVLAASSFSQVASAEVSANIGVTSNYLWRGMTQSSDSASVSGGLDYAADSGFYAGTWVGSLGEGSGAETDFYLGYGGQSGDFSYDVGYVYYAYTDLTDSNFGELYFNGSLGAFGFGVAYTANSEYDDGSTFDAGDLYYSVSYGFDLPNEYSLGLTAGYYDFDTDTQGDVDFAHIQADISKGDFTFSVSKAQTDSGDGDIKFVASWGTSF